MRISRLYSLKPISNVLLLHSAIIIDDVVLISQENAYSKLVPYGIWLINMTSYIGGWLSREPKNVFVGTFPRCVFLIPWRLPVNHHKLIGNTSLYYFQEPILQNFFLLLWMHIYPFFVIKPMQNRLNFFATYEL